jgi:hypothetical protein
MGAYFKVGAVAVLASIAMVDHAFARPFWYCPPVPEFDGASSVAAIALLLSVGAILFGDSKK